MLNVMNQGGPVMWVILACSVAVLTIFFERLLHLHRAQIKTDDFLKGLFNVLRRKNIVEAVNICDETPGPAAYIAREAILHYDEGRHEVEKAVANGGRREIARLERNLPLLATLAKITPIIGLLGTVLGLLDAMAIIQQKAPLVHAGDLAGSMWSALLTTAFGLAVAVPAYVGYNLLVGRVESIVLDMDHCASEVIAFLAGENLSSES